MSGSAGGQVLDHYLHTQFEVIRVVHENLDAIRAVASHLTPVEDLVDFQDQIVDVHAKLGALVMASDLILAASPEGIALLHATGVAAQRTLLELKSAALQDAEYFATADAHLLLNNTVGALSLSLDGALLALQDKASQADLTALNAALQLDLEDLRSGVLVSVDQRIADIIQDLQNGTYTAGLSEAVGLLTGRVDQLENVQQTHANQLAGLTSDVQAVNADLAAKGQALSTLGARVNDQGGNLDVLATSVTQLNTQIGELDGAVGAQGSALQSLSSRTQSVEGTLLSQSEQLVQLNARTSDALNGLDTQSTAVQQLTTKVSQNESQQTALSQSVIQLGSRISDAETGLETQSLATEELRTQLTMTDESIEAMSESITTLSSGISSAGNLLVNPGFESGTSDWEIFSRGTGWLSGFLDHQLDQARLPTDTPALGMSVESGVPAGELGVRGRKIAIPANKDLFLSGYLAAENCTVRLEWRIYDRIGGLVEFGFVGSSAQAPGTNLAQWARKYAKVPVPADGDTLEVIAMVGECHTGIPKAWLLRPLVEEAMPGQLAPSSWSGGTGGAEVRLAEAQQELRTQVEETAAKTDILSESLTSLSSSFEGVVTTDALAQLEARIQQASDAAALSLRQLSDIGSDAILTPNEKPFVIRDYQAILDEKVRILEESNAAITAAQARVTEEVAAGSLTPAQEADEWSQITALQGRLTTYQNALVALDQYLETLLYPVKWNDLSGNTVLV